MLFRQSQKVNETHTSGSYSYPQDTELKEKKSFNDQNSNYSTVFFSHRESKLTNIEKLHQTLSNPVASPVNYCEVKVWNYKWMKTAHGMRSFLSIDSESLGPDFEQEIFERRVEKNSTAVTTREELGIVLRPAASSASSKKRRAIGRRLDAPPWPQVRRTQGSEGSSQ